MAVHEIDDTRFGTSELSGAVASALIDDLRCNRLTFGHFPEVIVRQDGDGFSICLQACGVRGSRFRLDGRTVLEEVLRFRQGAPAGKRLFETIQEYAAELEGLVSDHKWHPRHSFNKPA